MKDLIARLESETKGSRELDAEVYNACPEAGRVAVQLPMEKWGDRFDDGWRTKWAHKEDKYPEELPHYTTSIDAALQLVPEGRYWKAQGSRDRQTNWVWVEIDEAESVAIAATPALALCIAALKAREAQG